ncbi:MAG: hypothetical protein GY824_19770, partial [Delftia sp.]|nr:hypothetical protein [Delftia sp.]
MADWLWSIIQERIDFEQAAFAGLKRALAEYSSRNFMQNDRREHTIFFTLGTFCALIYIANYVAHIISRFSYPLLLLASAWVVAFVLKPVAQWVDQGIVPDTFTEWVRRRWGERYADLLRAARI